MLMTGYRLVPKDRNSESEESLVNDGQDTREKVKKEYRPNGVRLNEFATAARVSGIMKRRKKERDEQKKLSRREKKDVGGTMAEREGRHQRTFANDLVPMPRYHFGLMIRISSFWGNHMQL